jgi:hypothetical protein
MAQATCSQCDAQYNSDRELRDHMGVAHRKFGSEQCCSEPSETQSNSSAMQGHEE